MQWLLFYGSLNVYTFFDPPGIYLKKTKRLRKSFKLFISYIKTHKVQLLKIPWLDGAKTSCQSGVDMSKYSTNSCRSAASSNANNGVPLKTMLDSADWASGKTFARHYNKSIDKDAFIQGNLLPWK